MNLLFFFEFAKQALHLRLGKVRQHLAQFKQPTSFFIIVCNMLKQQSFVCSTIQPAPACVFAFLFQERVETSGQEILASGTFHNA